MKNNIRLKIRDLVRRGGSKGGNQLKIEPPKVSATSAADKVSGNIAKQAEMDAELVDMNKKLAGGAQVVPQMGQAGASGNGSIKQQIGSAMTANADGEYDTQVMNAGQAEAASKSSIGGRRRRKNKSRKSRRKSRKKSKKGGRRKTKRRKRKTKRRRGGKTNNQMMDCVNKYAHLGPVAANRKCRQGVIAKPVSKCVDDMTATYGSKNKGNCANLQRRIAYSKSNPKPGQREA